MPSEVRSICRACPQTLDDALTALEGDHKFLSQGSLFTEDVIETWIDFKRKEEVAAVGVRLHPYEFVLHVDDDECASHVMLLMSSQYTFLLTECSGRIA